MKALSIWQPWAYAIVHLGKDIENRAWRFPPSYRGPILIHASQRRPGGEFFDFVDVYERAVARVVSEEEERTILGALQYGGIIGVATLVDVVHSSTSPWFFGPMGFVLRDARPLPFVPFRGAQGFFDVEIDLGPSAPPHQAPPG